MRDYINRIFFSIARVLYLVQSPSCTNLGLRPLSISEAESGPDYAGTVTSSGLTSVIHFHTRLAYYSWDFNGSEV